VIWESPAREKSAKVVLAVIPDITFDYEGPAEHPPDDAIPSIDISMQVTFRTQDLPAAVKASPGAVTNDGA
jgi:hypothetical protein